MDELNATGKLFGEVIALRIAVKRLLAHWADSTGDFDGALRSEHGAALDDLGRMAVSDDDPQRRRMIVMHAERVIDEIYTTMKKYIPPAQW